MSDRLTRMRLALELGSAEHGAHRYFEHVLHSTNATITTERNELQTLMRSNRHTEAELVRKKIQSLEQTRDAMMRHQKLIAEMVFRTIRDTYNADAAPESRVDAVPETALVEENALDTGKDRALLAEVRSLLAGVRGQLE